MTFVISGGGIWWNFMVVYRLNLLQKEVSITAVMFNGVVSNTIVMSAHNVIFGAGISEFRVILRYQWVL